MELGGKSHHFYGSVVSEPLNGLGKRSMEWDLNEWRWDGDFLRAAPLNAVPSDCRSRQFFPVCPSLPVKDGFVNFLSPLPHGPAPEAGMDRRDSEKRRRYVERNEEENGSLNLNLGGQVCPAIDRDADKWEKSGKKSKLSGVQPGRTICQVEGCTADLSNAKDYHRRHKVCEVHSKASAALVGNVMQRFCQQCSRFHALEEFDDGKRSCRRRLAGHNKRRRKAHPENVVGSSSVSDEQGAKYLLTSLLRILSNTQSSSSGQTNDQDLLSHLLRNLATVAGATSPTSPSELLPVSQNSHNAGTVVKDKNPDGRGLTLPSDSLMQKSAPNGFIQVEPACEASPPCSSDASAKVGRIKMSNIDLNSVYDDTEECSEDFLDNVPRDNPENVSPCLSPWSFKESQRCSPFQNSGNSGSSQSQTPSTSSGESRTHTDRIVFKLFNKNPNDLPLDLRKQIFDWLSNSPTDIESYIRPGCIVLTIYACMDKSNWDELHCNLHFNLRKLLNASCDPFWRSEWIYARVQNHASLAYNGHVVLDKPIPLNAHQSCRISTITPIAVSFSESAHFVIKGYNLTGPSSRLHCVLEGRYLLQEKCADIVGDDYLMSQEEFQCFGFSCNIPDAVGRGFIEVEDYCLNSSFFPFIVAEQDVCAEVRDLETVIEVTDNASSDKLEARNQALNFVHELGWLLHKSHLVSRLGKLSQDLALFPFWRYKYLIEFSIDHEWPAVVRKLLDVLLDGTVVAEGNTSVLSALFDVGLLHRAVRKSSVPMVKFLLTYQPTRISIKLENAHERALTSSFMFKPDASGPGGVTPLHLAAGLDDSDAVIDSLTEDPESVGIEAWRNTPDSAGMTPHDYAYLRGHFSYIHLVERKLNKKHGVVALDIPDGTAKQTVEHGGRIAALETEKSTRKQLPMMSCKRCRETGAYGSPVAIYRPAMLSMLAIAAICVCAALLFKSSPEVVFSFRPFRWEQLKYGAE